MKETRADAVRAIGYALLLHALPLALAILGLWWPDNRVSGNPTATMIEAEVVDPDTLPASIRVAMKQSIQPQQAQAAPIPPKQPAPAPIPQEAREEPLADAQERIAAPDTGEQERVEQDAETDVTEPQTREAAEASANVDGTAINNPPRGNNGVDADLFVRYRAAVREAILRNWTRPGWVQVGARCKLMINQIPGGEVTEVQVDPSCPYDELDRRSLEAAVLQAQSLPYSGFEAVFQRVLTLDFEAPE